MTQIVTDAGEQGLRQVEIIVNKKPVRIEGHEATGLEIKQAAIHQGVDIQLDFQLAEIRPDGEHRIIGDADKIHLHEGEKFIATASDDNS
jgi:hypothetical protein